MIVKKRILITLNEDVEKMLQDIMERNYIDTTSQAITRLIVAEYQLADQKPKRGRPLKDENKKSTEETSPQDEDMVYWEGDDMNPPRYMTREEYETRIMSHQN